MSGAKRLVSGVLTLLLAAGLFWLLDHTPHRRGKAVQPILPAERRATSYHGGSLAASDILPPQATCASCHERAPHKAQARLAAFLNLHGRALECLVCHGSGSLALSRDKTTGFVVATSGGSPIAPPEVSGRVHAFGQGVAFTARPDGCRSCHARGAGILSTPGLYDEYRRRILEELDVLPSLEEGR